MPEVTGHSGPDSTPAARWLAVNSTSAPLLSKNRGLSSPRTRLIVSARTCTPQLLEALLDSAPGCEGGVVSDEAIFLLHGGKLNALAETEYPKEDILQQVLEDYPTLIAGFATAGGTGRLLLIRREMAVPGSEGPSGLSLDHLFVDEVGVPVLVEVKRSADTRIRREVVAQMLDYAANGSAHWPVEQLRAAVAVQAAKGNTDELQLLQECLGVSDADAFWLQVEDNLRAGRIRCIFLADRLPAGLVRIIEYLNEQMRDTEVLGVELPQFTGVNIDSVVYVPRVVGRTSSAVAVKTGAGKRWDKSRLLDAVAQHCTAQEQALVEGLLKHCEQHSGRFSWGNGATAGVTGWYPVVGTDTPVWNLNIGADGGQGAFYFIFKEYVSRHKDRADLYAKAVGDVPGTAVKLQAAAASDWRSWVPMLLAEAAAAQAAVLTAVSAAIAPSPGVGPDAPSPTSPK